MQRTGNRCGRQSQHVDALFPLFDLFLLGYAKPLLLVYDQQSQIVERNISLQQPVGTDHHVDIPLLQLLQVLGNFFVGYKTADHGDSHPERFQPFPAGKQMLLGQHCCGHQQGYLFSVHNGLKCRTQGHLGFPVAHIPAEQAVHGDGFFHIRFDLCNGFHLVRCFLEGEPFLKLPLQIRIRRIGIPIGNLPQGIQADQFLRQLGDGGRSLCLHPLPFSASHFGKLGGDAFAANVFM